LVRRIEADRARVAMMASYQAVTDDVGRLRDDELARPSRCQGWPGAEGYAGHARFVRRVASSYQSDLVIAAQWAETAAAATHAAALPSAGAKPLSTISTWRRATRAWPAHQDQGWLSPGRRLTAPSGNRFLLAGTTWITC